MIEHPHLAVIRRYYEGCSTADVALMRLVALDRDKHILSRDVSMIDMRLPDRVVVRLSDEAAGARDAAMKARAPKRKGADT